MPIPVTCDCGQAFRAKDDLAGKSVPCPKCGQALTIPIPLTPQNPAGGSALEELMRLDAAAAPMPDPTGQPGTPVGQPGMPAQNPFGGGFQAPAQFGQPAAQPRSSSGSNRGFLIAICCLGGVGLLAVVGIVLMFVLGGDDSAPRTASSDTKPPTESAPKEPAAKPISLAALGPVTLDPGGKATVEISVDRNGNEGPVQVQFANLPAGITATAAEIPADQSTGQIELSAAQSLGDAELKAGFQVTVKVGEVEAVQPLTLTVNKLNLPSFQPATAVVLQPGTSAEVTLTLQRNGFEGPLELRVENLPAKTTAVVGKLSANEDSTEVQITAAGDAPDGSNKIRAAATVLGRTIQVEIPVQIVKSPFNFNSLKVVTLAPGEEKRVAIPVTRRGFSGTIRMAVTNLPAGVTVPAVELAADQPTATLVVTAAKDAGERVRSSVVTGTAGALRHSDYLIIRVSTGEGGGASLLPKDVTDNPELPGLLRRGGFGGRMTANSKAILADYYGGTKESEAAVLRGLAWLAMHQQSDGRWPLKAYNTGITGCDCCDNFEQGVTDSNTAGTAFGVLPFLGAGVSPTGAPKEPPELAQYQKNVLRAIRFLVRSQVVASDATSGRLDTNMYAHALGTMALCEAYGITGDERWKVPAQLAIKYLVNSQHKAGGWRYGPNQAGDLSATGWMFLAIRNGQLAGIPIRSLSLNKAERFVNSCAVGPEGAKGSQYTYVPGPEAAPKLTMTAAGLLSQQYLGWRRERPDLIAGAEHLMKNLPPKASSSLGQIYYHYYATQVLHHMGGENFDLWNHLMREHLIRTQQHGSHKDGSWNPQGVHFGERGGRLYSTSMALMTLEVYYRHLPLYGPAAVRGAKE